MMLRAWALPAAWVAFALRIQCVVVVVSIWCARVRDTCVHMCVCSGPLPVHNNHESMCLHRVDRQDMDMKVQLCSCHVRARVNVHCFTGTFCAKALIHLTQSHYVVHACQHHGACVHAGTHVHTYGIRNRMSCTRSFP